MFLVLAALGVELGKYPPQVFPRGVAFSLILLSGSAMAMEPLTAAERARALHRAETVLIPTRTVRKETREGREKLLKLFGRWLFDNHQVSLEFLLAAKPADPEEICKWLVLYGQDMFLSGKAYGSFSETITLLELPGRFENNWRQRGTWLSHGWRMNRANITRHYLCRFCWRL